MSLLSGVGWSLSGKDAFEGKAGDKECDQYTCWYDLEKFRSVIAWIGSIKVAIFFSSRDVKLKLCRACRGNVSWKSSGGQISAILENVTRHVHFSSSSSMIQARRVHTHFFHDTRDTRGRNDRFLDRGKNYRRFHENWFHEASREWRAFACVRSLNIRYVKKLQLARGNFIVPRQIPQGHPCKQEINEQNVPLAPYIACIYRYPSLVEYFKRIGGVPCVKIRSIRINRAGK